MNCWLLLRNQTLETLTVPNQMMVMLMAPMKEDSLIEEHGKEGAPKEEPFQEKPVPLPSKPGRQCWNLGTRDKNVAVPYQENGSSSSSSSQESNEEVQEQQMPKKCRMPFYRVKISPFKNAMNKLALQKMAQEKVKRALHKWDWCSICFILLVNTHSSFNCK